MNKIKNEISNIWDIVKTLDKKVLIVFISVAVLQTVSYYYTSRQFFRNHFYYTIFKDNPLVNLIEYLYWFLGDFLVFFILPILIIVFLLKGKPGEYGVCIGKIKIGLIFTGLFLIIMIPLLWFVSSLPGFAAKYPHLSQAKIDWGIFFIYECGMFLYLFAWEYIWRGFMLFGLEKKFGYYAVLIQMIPFVILHNGKPDIETFSAILGGIALGVLALRTRTFIYGVIVHFGIMFFIDIFGALRMRAQEFGIGLDSFINGIKELF